jgi:hypothetical protein
MKYLMVKYSLFRSLFFYQLEFEKEPVHQEQMFAH